MGPGKVEKSEGTRELQVSNIQSATLLKRSGNVVIGTSRDQKPVTATPPAIAQTKIDKDHSFSQAKALPEKELNQRMQDGFGSVNVHQSQDNSGLLPDLPPVPPPLPPQIKGKGESLTHETKPFKEELTKVFEAKKINYSGSKLESLDRNISQKQLESAKSLLSEEKIITKDKKVLSETTYQNKPQKEKIKDLSDNDIKDFLKDFSVNGKKLTSFVGELDRTSNKEKVYSKAKDQSKEITRGLKPEMTLALKLRSDNELKEIVANSIAIKDKYHESHDKALSKYMAGMAKLGPLIVKIKDLYDYKRQDRTKMTSEQKEALIKEIPEIDKKMAEIKNKMYDIGKEYNLLKTLPKNRGDAINISNIKNPPSMYQVLPENKKQLVNSIVEGLKSGIPDQPSKEKVRFEKINLDIPKSITLNGKTYISPEFLAKGGLGAIFKYVNKDNPNDTVVIKNLLNPTKKEEMVTEIKNHVHAMGGKDKNPDVINLKGIVKGDNAELYMVMETAKDDAQNVFDKFKDLVNKNVISPETHEILKTVLSRDMMQSMLYIQKERNMIHLDLKPGNYLMNSEGKAVISDFGTSRRTQDAFNIKYSKDNPIFASPEDLSRNLENQDEKLLINEKSDIWTLGLCLHDINYGKTKFEADFASDTEDNIRNFGKNYNNRLIDNEATGLDRVINAMAHPDPRQRPTLEAVLKTSLFSDPKLDKPEVREIIRELFSKTPDLEKIKKLGLAIEK